MSASRRMKRLRRKPKSRVIGTFYSSRKPQRFQPGRGFRGLRLLKRLSALMSIVILNETVTFLQVLGGAVTVVGVVIAQMAQASRKSNEPP